MPNDKYTMRFFVIALCIICLQSLSPIKARGDTEGPKCILGPWVQDIKWPETNFSGKRFYGCVFIGQGFRNAVFDDCDFSGAQICQCDFRNASFKRANFNGLRLGDCRFEGADFTDAIINGIERFDGRHGHDYQLTADQFISTYSYKIKDLSNCFISIALENRKRVPYQFDFRGADLRGTQFEHCDLRKCDFTDAEIKGIVVKNDRFDASQIMSTKDFKRRMLIGVDLPINARDFKNDFSNIEFYDSKLRFILHPYNSTVSP